MLYRVIKIPVFISIILFFAEGLILKPNDLSFIDDTEKIFFWIGLIGGFFVIKRFILWFLGFVILSMIPMLVPFFMLLDWISNDKKEFYLTENIKVKETIASPLGNHYPIVIIEKRFFLEKVVLKPDVRGACGIKSTIQINSITLNQKKRYRLIRITFNDENNQSCTCEIIWDKELEKYIKSHDNREDEKYIVLPKEHRPENL